MGARQIFIEGIIILSGVGAIACAVLAAYTLDPVWAVAAGVAAYVSVPRGIR